ncbi:thymidylate synthase [Pseudolysinimonas kribbensis]|uniref:Thymidylate synthase n=1 Tax=Pseudolysinimonas kribbensis TaxID=433641 RepID=A0ABQ6K5C0_9MICO|nr:thymidylate synthase [Pseudolysinimonas kribbensis]GMA94921.1 thymidylate synthase [Pseudolysinimonas kribbensis]
MTAPDVDAATIGEAWLGIADRILRDGGVDAYDGLPIVELENVTIRVAAPRADDAIVAELGDPERLAWMHANFTDFARVPALGDARSYASRLYAYGETDRDQVRWVIERLRRDPASRSATITTFEPLLDDSYIPCVSLLDFWIRDGALCQVVYAHSIDFGAKGYGNLVELAFLQETVAAALGLPVGDLTFVIKSAHVYDTEAAYMTGVLAETTAATVKSK